MKNLIFLILLLPFNAMAQDDAACINILKAGLQAIIADNDKNVMYFSDRFNAECEITQSLYDLSENNEELKRLDALIN